MYTVNDESPDRPDASKAGWGVKEYVFALAGVVLVLFVAGMLKWENGSVALTDRSRTLIENVTDGDNVTGQESEQAPDPIPVGWVKVTGTGYSYGIPDDWYFAEPKDKYAISDERNADSIALDAELIEDASASISVVRAPKTNLDRDEATKFATEQAKKLADGGMREISWTTTEVNGKPALSFKGHFEVSGAKVIARQDLLFGEGLLIDRKYKKSSGQGKTLEKILRTWSWEK